MSRPPHIVFDPAAKKTIAVDWSPWLTGEGTAIASHTALGSDGITVHTHAEASGKVTALVSAARSGRVTVHIVCVDGQEDERSMPIWVQDL